MMNKKKCLIAILALTLCVGVASAALLEYYGRIVMTVDVHQAIWLDGKPYFEDVTEEFDIIPPKVILTSHYLESKSEKPITMQFATTYEPDGEGIDVSYLKSTNYKETVATVMTASTPNGIPINVAVEDIGEWVQWTFNFFAHNETAAVGGGKFAASVTISFDGVTPAIHVHNNDGTCSAFPWGTWLYSEYSDGWHTSEQEWNTEVTTIDWIEAEGEMLYVENAEGKLVIRVLKAELTTIFYWGVYTSTAHFSAGLPYTMSVYPEGFDWSSTPALVEAIILEEMTSSFTLTSGEHLDFYIRYEFAPILKPDNYIITTEVQLA